MIRILFLILFCSSAFSQRIIPYTILEKKENLEGVLVVTFKCLDESVLSIQCIEGETMCGLDKVPLDNALRRRCNEIAPPTPKR